LALAVCALSRALVIAKELVQTQYLAFTPHQAAVAAATMIARLLAGPAALAVAALSGLLVVPGCLVRVTMAALAMLVGLTALVAVVVLVKLVKAASQTVAAMVVMVFSIRSAEQQPTTLAAALAMCSLRSKHPHPEHRALAAAALVLTTLILRSGAQAARLTRAAAAALAQTHQTAWAALVSLLLSQRWQPLLRQVRQA
jgi:hypothetical protein